MPPFNPIKLQSTFSISKLYSFYYFHFAEGHVFPGERHDFWELVYVDHGELEIGTDTNTFLLRQGQITFHQPNEFHHFTIRSPKSSLMVFGFECLSPAMRRLSQRNFTLNIQEKSLLMRLLQEGEKCFGETLDSAYIDTLEPRKDAPPACQQMLRLFIEQLLIFLLRDLEEDKQTRVNASSVSDIGASSTLMDRLVQFMSEHLDGSLRFEDICRISGMSSTALKQYFREQTGTTVMNHYQRQRINEARRLLRDSGMNVTQVSELLGYTSIHAFSHQFKRITGMSPTDYLKTIIYK